MPFPSSMIDSFGTHSFASERLDERVGTLPHPRQVCCREMELTTTSAEPCDIDCVS